jgi:lipopolysaccharide export system protein LptC
MTRYAIVDVANLFYRARHVVRGDAYTKAGMALSIVFRSLKKLHREFKADHMVFCVEGHSWRYSVYPQYKAKRKLERMTAMATPSEREEEEAFNAVVNDFTNYMAEKTRCTVLQSQGVEGDDFIARWIQVHPNDEHYIVSGDTDFIQLLAPNVKIYNGVDDRLLTVDGVFDGQGRELVFSVKGDSGKLKVGGTIAEEKAKHDKEQKAKEKAHNQAERDRQKAWDAFQKQKAAEDPSHKPIPFVASTYEWEEFSFTPEPEWWRKALFVKLIRGDAGDGIFSSYPGVRYTSKTKVGICEAWNDRAAKGFDWNNFMLQRWEKLVGTDQNGNPIKKEVRVIDEYKFNESLIDLTQQPDEIKALMDAVIVQAVQKEPVGNVGIHFLRFCDRNNLPSLAKEANDHAAYLNAPY